jgi:hypothetical protein
MKLKPLVLLAIAVIGPAAAAFAQTNVGVRGSMSIAFNSRVITTAKDLYTLNLTVNDSVIFAGTITNTPFIDGVVSVSQHARIDYGVECSLINPRNAADIRPIGRFSGAVPITPDGLYDYGAGSLKIVVNQMGKAEGFESPFKGQAQGKPLKKKSNFLSKAKEALSVGKVVGGKTVTIAVKNYDTMVFSNSFIMAAGPVGVYPRTQVSGSMIYDYDRGAWYPKDVGVYSDNPGSKSNDKLTGSIRWVEKPRSGATRLGQYDFDLRINEPVGGEGAHFTPASDESSFFEVDTTLKSLSGTMKYTDTFSGDSVVKSEVVVALVGNQISKQQCMELAKLIIFSMVVPMNNE